MAVGFALGKLKFLDSSSIRGMSSLIVKATLPALIVMSLQKPFSKELLGESMKTLLVASIFYVGIIVLSLLAAKALRVDRKKAGAIAFSLAFSNCAFIGFPVIGSILGDGALFLTSIHNIVFNVLAFTVGIVIVSGGRTGGSGAIHGSDATAERFKMQIKNIFNINVIAAIVGFVFFVASVTIPTAIALPMNMLGGLTTPLAMVVTGAMLARTPIRSVLGDWKLYAVTVLRLALFPPCRRRGAVARRGQGRTQEYHDHRRRHAFGVEYEPPRGSVRRGHGYGLCGRIHDDALFRREHSAYGIDTFLI